MATKPRAKTDWSRLQRASSEAARREYRRTTPGQRVKEAIELSHELTKLAARRATRAD